jgi:hypothetical protein
MQDFAEPKTPKPGKAALVMLVMTAVMIGATSGVLIADRNALSVIKGNISARLTGILGNQPASVHAANTKPHTTSFQEEQLSEVIPIGLSSIGDIRYSLQSDFAHMDFDLASMNLIGTGVLGSPDRIYVDLRESGRIKSAVGRLKARKAIRIDGDPVTGVRISQWDSGAMRIVVDLSRPCDFTHQIVPGSPSRLILKIRPSATDASAPSRH